ARGRAKLADFGAAARLADPGQGVEPRPLSPFSASPEQLRGEPPAPSDDVYGLGALAYELLSRYPPHYPNFDARAAQRDPVPPLVPARQMPPQLGVLIARMLAKNAKERAASMRECIDALDAAALAAFVWLPRYARVQPEAPTALVNGAPAAGGAAAAFSAQRTVFDSRLAALESRGAGVWGGADFAGAKTRAAESVGAYDAGSLTLAQQRLAQASGLLDAVERAAPAALAAQLAAGERALAAGQQELAAQAFDLAARIDRQDRRAALG